MSITLRPQVTSLLIERNLGRATMTFSSAVERLSSGTRLARTDAAEQSISSGLRLNARVYTQATRNVNDAIGVYSIAEGALDQQTSILHRLAELATQAANGTLSTSQRKSLNQESEKLILEFDRIAETTSFNGLRLINGSLANTTFQVGVTGADYVVGTFADTRANQLGESREIVGTGTFSAATSHAAPNGAWALETADFNEDGNLDLITGDEIFFGNGDGSFEAGQAVNHPNYGDPLEAISVSDVNGDSHLDLVVASYSPDFINVLFGDGQGSFNVQQSIAIPTDGCGNQRLATADLNGDNRPDIALRADQYLFVYTNQGNGTFSAATQYTVGLGAVCGVGENITIGDLNGDGKPDIATVNSSVDHLVTVLWNAGDGTFGTKSTFDGGYVANTVEIADINNDEINDLIWGELDGATKVRLGSGSGSFGPTVTYDTPASDLELVDLNSDKYLDLISVSRLHGYSSVRLNNGDGSFASATTYLSVFGDNRDIVVADFDQNGANDFVLGDYARTSFTFRLGEGIEVGSGNLQQIDLSTRANALDSIDIVDRALSGLSLNLGKIGAWQGRLAATLNVISASRENTITAESRISDVDVAEETARLLAARLIQFTSAALSSQFANQSEIALQLLAGSA